MSYVQFTVLSTCKLQQAAYIHKKFSSSKLKAAASEHNTKQKLLQYFGENKQISLLTSPFQSKVIVDSMFRQTQLFSIGTLFSAGLNF